MTEGGGFAHIDTASAVRAVMKSIAKQEVEIQAPRPNYGRVISINIKSLTATVWFPGDEAPVTVNLFPNTVPGLSHESFGLGSGAGVVSTSYVGFGSRVAVQDFDGKLYITQVLSGGVMSVDAKQLNSSLVAQQATEIAADQAGYPTLIVGEPGETFINCSISNFNLGDGGAIQFGPFTGTETRPGVGWIEVTVTELNGAVKYYKFALNPLYDFQYTGGNGALDSWFRLVPEQQVCDINGQVIDFDFEVTLKKTPYGNLDNFNSNEELWMRVVKRGSSWTGLSCLVTIRATNIQKGRSLQGRELFMQESLASPAEAKGYLGFHNSQMIFRDFDDYGNLDNFGRTVTGTWGTSDSGIPYNISSGGAVNYGVDGTRGYVSCNSNSVFYTTINKLNMLNADVYWDVFTSVMPTGAEIQTGAVFRFRDLGNMYQAKVVFQTSGQITLSLVKGLGGSFSVMGTDYNPGITFTANERIRCRARVYGSGTNATIFIKAWKPATQREPDWVKFETDSGTILGANANNQVGFFAQPGGANTNAKPFKVYFDNIRATYYPKGQDNSGKQWHTGPWRSGLLRVAENLQKTWIHTGKTMTWDGTYLFWSDRLYFGGIGQHRMGLSAGSTQMQLPPSGTLIPIVPNGGTATATSQGIPLQPGQALWCAIPPGQSWENLYEYLFITSATATADFDMPEWAVLIAHRSDTATAPIRLGNGTHIDSLRLVTLTSPWTHYSPQLQYRKIAPNIVHLAGEVNVNGATNGSQVGVLPPEFSPFSTITIAGGNGGISGGHLVVAINSAGSINAFCNSGFFSRIQINGLIPLDM